MSDVPLFDELWDYKQPAETEERLRVLLPQAETDEDRSFHVQLLSQIARTHSLRQQFDQAHTLLDEAEGLLTDDLKVARVRVLLERGRTLNSSRTADRGYALFHEAWELARGAGIDFYAIDAAHMLGIVAETAESQLQWNLKALQLAEITDHARSKQWLGSLYNNIGWTYHDMGQFEHALLLFEKALDFYSQSDRPDNYRIARWSVARTYRSLGRVAEALAMQEALLTEHNTDDEAGYILEEIAECLLALDRLDEARPYFVRAYAVLSQDTWLTAHEAERLERLKQLWQPES
jgi:tetratricopeptide (TPR) repeat protein